jgi:hypothetical protein
MAYQAVNRAGASNSETDKSWQKTVLRDLTEQMSSAPTQEIRPADNERVSASVPDQLPDPALVIQRVGELSITEMDKTILELQKVRAFLVSEGERMRREMAEYIKLSQASIASTKAMSENIANFGSVVAEAGKKPIA